MSLLITADAIAKLPYIPITFPRDEAAHYGNVSYADSVTDLTEWWYFNGKVKTWNNRNLGYYVSYMYQQKIIFGKKVRTPIFVIQFTDIDKQKMYGGSTKKLPIIELDTQNLNVNYGKSITLRNIHGIYYLEGQLKTLRGHNLYLNLILTPKRPVVLSYDNTGYSYNSWGNSSMYYYSQPYLQTEGRLKIDDEIFDLNPEQSSSWMNRQWTDLLLGKNTQWLWADAQLDNGINLDLYQLYDPEAKRVFMSGANIIMPDNSTVFPQKIIYSPHPIPSGQRFPLVYDLSIPDINLQIQFTADAPNQNVNIFWEGVSSIEGNYHGGKVTGRGYTESTMRN